jgi:hypothetical protein
MAGVGRPSSLLAVAELRYTSLVSMLTFFVLRGLQMKQPGVHCRSVHPAR